MNKKCAPVVQEEIAEILSQTVTNLMSNSKEISLDSPRQARACGTRAPGPPGSWTAGFKAHRSKRYFQNTYKFQNWSNSGEVAFNIV